MSNTSKKSKQPTNTNSDPVDEMISEIILNRLESRFLEELRKSRREVSRQRQTTTKVLALPEPLPLPQPSPQPQLRRKQAAIVGESPD